MTVVVQPRTLNIRKTIIVATVLIAFFVYTYLIRDPAGPANPVFSGETMGTTYTVKIVDASLSQRDLRKLAGDITRRLADVNRQMSTYLEDSEISRFNRSTATDGFQVSPAFALVSRRALEICRDTDGAFDPTLGPLINLWGFGHTGQETVPPEPEDLRLARARCGYKNLEVLENNQLRKVLPELEVNLSAIAKGYGVDSLSDLLASHDLTNTYVEIGGEIRVRGTNLSGESWRIGIDTPTDHAALGENITSVLALRDRAIATSGDYRNYFEDGSGARRSHLIDPRTGRPVTHPLASATVLASDCMTADAVATALMVLGPEAAQAWVEQRPGIEALLIIRTEAGFQTVSTPGIDAVSAPIQP